MRSAEYAPDDRPSAAEYDYYERMATDPRFRAEVENIPDWWEEEHRG